MNTAKHNLPYDLVQEAAWFARSVRQVVGGRKMFVTVNGYMGLCHPNVGRGDLVVTVAGALTPYILMARDEVAGSYRFEG
jgi:hypothetical protein